MEKIWSPWRSEYIDSFKNKKDDETCVFCDAEKKDINDDSNLIVYKADYNYVMLNLYPYNSGHLMVIPYRHLSDFTLLEDEELLEAMKLMQLSEKALTSAMKPQGFNIGANIGKISGAGIDSHLHFHLVPRWNGDTNFMPVIGEVKVISQDLLQTKNRLLEAFTKVENE